MVGGGVDGRSGSESAKVIAVVWVVVGEAVKKKGLCALGNHIQ